MPEDMSLEGQSLQFAQRIETLLTRVLGKPEDPYTDEPEEASSRGYRRFSIHNAADEGIRLKSDSTDALILSYAYLCSCRNTGDFLQVDQSHIMVSAASNGMPIFGYDYVRDAGPLIPSAHINIHGSNDDAVRIMLACASRARGRSRRKEYVKTGKFPSFSTLHFPVGGDRFRPGLEDVLEMLIKEFAIDVQQEGIKTIQNSRAEYRERQFRAFIHEFPDIAYKELKDEGYDLKTTPPRPQPHTNDDRLHKY